jgi:hypothetical protein
LKEERVMKATILVALAALIGCGPFGRVNQGQVVEYQRGKGLVTLIQDSNYRDPVHPRFDVLPALTIRVPEDPREMGPEPEAGKLLLLDYANRRAVIFDSATQSLRSVPYGLVSEQDNVAPTDARVSRIRLPLVDRARRTITIYAGRDRKLIAISIPEEYAALPADTWKTGDEVRYYYKDPSRALRLMNVSKTDLNKAGK